MRVRDTSLPEAFQLEGEILAELKHSSENNGGRSFALAIEKYLEISHFRKKEDLSAPEAKALDAILAKVMADLNRHAPESLKVVKEDTALLYTLRKGKKISFMTIVKAQETLLKLLIAEVFFPHVPQSGFDRRAIVSYWMTELSLLPDTPLSKQLLTPELDFLKSQFELTKAA